jgi:prepilin-type N-terminal cleavage/methylation domain-containing protein
MQKLSRGFSMIEVIVSLGVLAIVGGVGLMVSMEGYRGGNFHAERALVVSLLQHTRTEALASVCSGSSCTDARAHGVYIDEVTKKYVLFEGASYATRDTTQDRTLDASPALVRSGLSETVFTPYSADSATPGTITLTGEGRTSVITIGGRGQISWTN